MRLQSLPETRIPRVVSEASRSPKSDARVRYPHWYLKRWHFLPEGYLSRRSLALYEAAIIPIYNAGAEHWISRALIRAVRQSAPASVLDIGCGPGRLLTQMGRALAPCSLAGVDLSPFALERAADRLALAGISADLRHADAQSLPFPDAAFDAVTAWHVPGHVPDETRHALLAEAARVLRPGGILVSVEHTWHAIEPVPGLTSEHEQRMLGGLVTMRTWRRAA